MGSNTPTRTYIPHKRVPTARTNNTLANTNNTLTNTSNTTHTHSTTHLQRREQRQDLEVVDRNGKRGHGRALAVQPVQDVAADGCARTVPEQHQLGVLGARRALASELTAGVGAREAARTLWTATPDTDTGAVRTVQRRYRD